MRAKLKWTFYSSCVQIQIRTNINPIVLKEFRWRLLSAPSASKNMEISWVDLPSQAPKVDYTNPVDEKGDDNIQFVPANHQDSLMDKNESGSNEEEAGTATNPNAKKKGWFPSMFQSVAKAILGKSDLEPALKALKDGLMTKNVAEEVAGKLGESVAASLEGKKRGSFSRISLTVQTAMEEALLRILTPGHSVDILRDVHAAKKQGRPYIVVFVGANGVGKSTNLAKVAYWLQEHNISVMMADCDRFQSGDEKKLRIHARRLRIPIFERGYGEDPADVAKKAIKEAADRGSDVVLVDTAGRMQDKNPLMKLINLNSPDLVLLVGAALVGNDAVNQMSKFNQKLALLASSDARSINGILLTKYDTIDDKVGAIYRDLKKLNVKSIGKTLLK